MKLIRRNTLLFVMLILISSINSVFSQTENYSRLKIWFDGRNESELSKLGIDLSEGELKLKTYFISDFSEKEFNSIKSHGFRTDVMIQDVKKYYRENNNSTARRLLSVVNCNLTGPAYPIPAHFTYGSMGGYYTYSEMLSILDQMATQYPDLITIKQPVDTTNSIEGRPIYFVKISDNPNVDEAEPQVLYTAVHHAREPESLSQMIYYLWYLLENYQSDSLIHALVDNTEMDFIPCINPDGYLYNESTDPAGGGMWRKNRRDNLNGDFGVDLNRNYGYEWGHDTLGSSNDTETETYRGTSPFSEPETQAVRNFVNRKQFRLSLNYHTYGNHLIVPWGFVADSLSPDSNAFNTYGNALTRYNNYHVGTTTQTLNYLANGGSDDWMYGEQLSKPKVFAMTPEVGVNYEGFWPPAVRIEPMSEENVYPNLMLAKLAGKYGLIDISNSHYASQAVNYCSFTFTPAGLDTTGSYTISIQPITSNIISVGNSVSESLHNILMPVTDSVSYTLNAGIAQGDEIKYLLVRNNGYYSEYDTVTQIFGTPVLLLNDDCTTLNNWDVFNTGWLPTTEDFISAPSSITDSPNDNYFPSTVNAITLVSPVILTGARDARLTFYSKWAIEPTYDYLQVLASADNGFTWIPLCGKYSIAGNMAQLDGQPLYSGFQSWIKEEMNLNDFLGQNILIQFRLVPDDFNEFDGFYFDDLKVEAVVNNTSISLPDYNNAINAYPNPAKDHFTISYPEISNPELIIADVPGKIIQRYRVNNNSRNQVIGTDHLSAGIYSCYLLRQDGSRTTPVKIVINK